MCSRRIIYHFPLCRIDAGKPHNIGTGAQSAGSFKKHPSLPLRLVQIGIHFLRRVIDQIALPILTVALWAFVEREEQLGGYEAEITEFLDKNRQFLSRIREDILVLARCAEAMADKIEAHCTGSLFLGYCHTRIFIQHPAVAGYAGVDMRCHGKGLYGSHDGDD